MGARALVAVGGAAGILSGLGAAWWCGLLPETNRAVEVRAQRAVKDLLRDPNSAVFSNVRASHVRGAACGEVNARNAYGAMVGHTAWVLDPHGRAHLDPGVVDMDAFYGAAMVRNPGGSAVFRRLGQQVLESCRFYRMVYRYCLGDDARAQELLAGHEQLCAARTEFYNRAISHR